SEALEGISLPKSIKDSLIEHEGILMPIFNLLNAYEHGDWERAYELVQSLKLNEEDLFDAYMDAVKWARETVRLMYLKS
ncbi:MAG TPA: diguanylate phosphodiesterase, partial [Fusibacter sp.]|nr:diguanylate phosphodiesterase [Fusibacter sp.]